MSTNDEEKPRREDTPTATVHSMLQYAGPLTSAEIATRTGKSVGAVANALRRLEADGVARRTSLHGKLWAVIL